MNVESLRETVEQGREIFRAQVAGDAASPLNQTFMNGALVLHAIPASGRIRPLIDSRASRNTWKACEGCGLFGGSLG
jgi:hypothetical protein